jgi:hypothetical protein
VTWTTFNSDGDRRIDDGVWIETRIVVLMHRRLARSEKAVVVGGTEITCFRRNRICVVGIECSNVACRASKRVYWRLAGYKETAPSGRSKRVALGWTIDEYEGGLQTKCCTRASHILWGVGSAEN